ncbi:MAG: hypothetical protein WA821_18670, partial [Anaerolineales bacterium]
VNQIITPGGGNMIEKLSTFLGRIAKGWLALILFVVNLALLGDIFPSALRRLTAFPGSDGFLDSTFFPSAGKIFSAVASYGPDGRFFYATSILTADILFPIAYTLFLSLLITALLRRAFDKDSQLQRLNVIPFSAGLFDLLENTCIVVLLLSFPAQSTLAAGVLTFANGFKWIFLGISILTLLLAFGALIVKKIKGT